MPGRQAGRRAGTGRQAGRHRRAGRGGQAEAGRHRRAGTGRQVVVTTSHVSTTISPTVDLPNPNSDARVRYSTFVASFQTVTATRSSTLTRDLMLVHFFCI